MPISIPGIGKQRFQYYWIVTIEEGSNTKHFQATMTARFNRLSYNEQSTII